MTSIALEKVYSNEYFCDTNVAELGAILFVERKVLALRCSIILYAFLIVLEGGPANYYRRRQGRG